MLYAALALVSGVNIELSTNDLSSKGRVLDNIKGSWSQTLTFLGKSATLEAEYDRNARDDFLDTATLSGKLDDIAYEVKTSFGDTHELTLSCDTKDGTAVEVEANNKDGLTSITATRDVKINGRDYTAEASHDRQASSSKLKMSSVLGHGVTGSATWTVGNKLDSADYELEYETELTNGRKLSATVNPRNGKGDIEYVDTTTIDAEITASMDLGGKPAISVKRGWTF